MKKKIPFSLEYRDKIESGEIQVVTRDDRPVRIICWDVNKKNLPILALMQEGDHERHLYCAVNGYTSRTEEDSNTDLFILVEDELTEFEKAYSYIRYGGSATDFMVETCSEEQLKTIKEEAAKLLELARKQLEPIMEYEYLKGKNDALKDMPKWKHVCSFQSYTDNDMFITENYLRCGNMIISLEDLKKLPKEE